MLSSVIKPLTIKKKIIKFLVQLINDTDDTLCLWGGKNIIIIFS